MTSGRLEILLLGPLVFIDLEDRLRNKTTLVISSNPDSLELYCGEKEEEFPSLMPVQDRWHGDIMAVDEGQIQMKSLSPEVGMSSSAEFVRYIVFFKDWAILAVCLSTKSKEEIRKVLEYNGLPEVLEIQLEGSIGDVQN